MWSGSKDQISKFKEKNLDHKITLSEQKLRSEKQLEFKLKRLNLIGNVTL